MNFCKECISNKVLQDICNMEQNRKDAEETIRKCVRSRMNVKEYYDELLQQFVDGYNMSVYWHTKSFIDYAYHPKKTDIIRDEFAKILNENFGGYFVCQSVKIYDRHDSLTRCQRTWKRMN